MYLSFVWRKELNRNSKLTLKRRHYRTVCINWARIEATKKRMFHNLQSQRLWVVTHIGCEQKRNEEMAMPLSTWIGITFHTKLYAIGMCRKWAICERVVCLFAAFCSRCDNWLSRVELNLSREWRTLDSNEAVFVAMWNAPHINAEVWTTATATMATNTLYIDSVSVSSLEAFHCIDSVRSWCRVADVNRRESVGWLEHISMFRASVICVFFFFFPIFVSQSISTRNCHFC